MGRGGRGRRVGGAASDGLCCSGATDGSAGVFGVGEGVLVTNVLRKEAMGWSNQCGLDLSRILGEVKTA